MRLSANQANLGRWAIPGPLNCALLVGAALLCAALLYTASHSASLLTKGLCALAFSFTANTIFSLLHEAVHGLFSANRQLNDWAGRFAAAWFPTGYTLQRAFHLTHHRNNRSAFEQFDVLHPGDIRWLKYAQWYAILSGLYWAVAVLGAALYCLLPGALRLGVLRGKHSQIAMQTSSGTYLQATESLHPWLARMECAFSFGWQLLLFWALDLSLLGWLLCYGAFAVQWSSLQYTDHAFSPLDAHHGAWNLRVGWLGRTLFLNYHLHLAHHQNLRAPWLYLPDLVPPDSLRPGFWRVWWVSWRGPRKPGDFPRFDLPATPAGTHKTFGLPRGRHAQMAWLTAAVVGLVFVALYGGASLLAPWVPWQVRLDFAWESHIPFVPAAALVYLSMNLLLCLTPLVLRRWQELFPLAACLVVETGIASLCFLLMPVHTGFPERHASGWVGSVFAWADTVNLEGNFFPSLHVAFACTAVWALWPRLRGLWRSLFALWAVAIALSTVLMHEHHVLDVVGGIALAVVVWRTTGTWAQQARVLQAVKVDALCLYNFMQFAQRHRRYGLIAVGLLAESLGRWQARRILRTGFCFLQVVDDILDGDRPSEQEPLEVVDEVVLSIRTGNWGSTDLMCLARAFVDALRQTGEPLAADYLLQLIAVMRRDRCRSLNQTLWSAAELQAHHRATFSLSVDLMLIARGSRLRASDVPALTDLLGWCSTVRDLREDLEAGLVNIPLETLQAAQYQPGTGFAELLSHPAVREWLRSEHRQARALTATVQEQLRSLGNAPGKRSLRLFASSIRSYTDKKFMRMYPQVFEGQA